MTEPEAPESLPSERILEIRREIWLKVGPGCGGDPAFNERYRPHLHISADVFIESILRYLDEQHQAGRPAPTSEPAEPRGGQRPRYVCAHCKKPKNESDLLPGEELCVEGVKCKRISELEAEEKRTRDEMGKYWSMLQDIANQCGAEPGEKLENFVPRLCKEWARIADLDAEVLRLGREALPDNFSSHAARSSQKIREQARRVAELEAQLAAFRKWSENLPDDADLAAAAEELKRPEVQAVLRKLDAPSPAGGLERALELLDEALCDMTEGNVGFPMQQTRKAIALLRSLPPDQSERVAELNGKVEMLDEELQALDDAIREVGGEPERGIAEFIRETHRIGAAMSVELDSLRKTLTEREAEAVQFAGERDEARKQLAQVHAEIGKRASHGPVGDAACIIEWIADAKSTIAEAERDEEALRSELTSLQSKVARTEAFLASLPNLEAELVEVRGRLAAWEAAARLAREILGGINGDTPPGGWFDIIERADDALTAAIGDGENEAFPAKSAPAPAWERRIGTKAILLGQALRDAADKLDNAIGGHLNPTKQRELEIREPLRSLRHAMTDWENFMVGRDEPAGEQAAAPSPITPTPITTQTPAERRPNTRRLPCQDGCCSEVCDGGYKAYDRGSVYGSKWVLPCKTCHPDWWKEFGAGTGMNVTWWPEKVAPEAAAPEQPRQCMGLIGCDERCERNEGHEGDHGRMTEEELRSLGATPPVGGAPDVERALTLAQGMLRSSRGPSRAFGKYYVHDVALGIVRALGGEPPPAPERGKP
jgi:DNA-binding transcriptional MerR regulator